MFGYRIYMANRAAPGSGDLWEWLILGVAAGHHIYRPTIAWKLRILVL